MSLRKRLLVKPAAAPGGLVPSEHFGVVLYEGDGLSSHSINGGKFGAGAYTNGSNSNLTYPQETFDINKSHTVSGWVYLRALQDEDMLFYNHDSNVRLRGNYSVKYRRNLVNTAYDVNSTTTLSTNTWYHIVYTFSTTNGMELYINGSSEGTNSYTGDASVHSSDYGLMYRADNGSQRTEGKIDQVRIFTKALSSSEVSTLYAETASTVESLDPLSEDTTDTLQVLGDTSCIATYRFENNEDDESGNFDGTGTEIQYAAGRYGQAASFNGTASRISTSLDFDNYDENWSISYWIKFTFNTNYRAILGSTDATAKNGMVSDISTSGEIRFRLRSGSTSVSSLTSTATYGDGNWHHVVCIKGSSTNYLYIDNELDSSTATTNGINHSALAFGTLGEYNVEFLKGELDQVRIFNKALSASEVTTLYNENSLVASYRFEGNANDDTRNYDGTATNVTYEYGLNFTPDFIWTKSRTNTNSHALYDSTRGVNKELNSNSTDAQGSLTDGISSFDTGGFTVGARANSNQDGQDFVGWAWKANGGTTSSNTDGSITTTVQSNTDAGFSILKYNMNLTSGTFTIGHGLNSAPELVIFKTLGTSNSSWIVYPNDNSKILVLDSTGAASSGSSYWNSASPTSTVINMGTGWTSNHTYYAGDTIAYAFHSVDGFSKIGSYTGNGSTNGPIVETGFEPAFVMVKNTTTAGYLWLIADNKRQTDRLKTTYLQANSNAAEYSPYTWIEFFSNGFQLKNTGSSLNANGDTYLYMAFAADPDTEAPAVAKSFFATTYDGTGADGNSVGGFGFKPGLLWLKRRNSAADHWLFDIVRGPFKLIESSTTDVENNRTTSVASFDDDGFTIDNDTAYNNTTDDYIAWAWKADDNEPTIFGGPALAVYKFEDNANDVTGNNNGTASNVTYTSSGKFNKAAVFNGSSSYVSVPISNSIQSTIDSISVWVRFNSIGTNQAITNLGDSTADNSPVKLRLDATTNKIRLVATNSSKVGESIYSTTVVSANTWYHVAATWTGSSWKLYINGTNEATTSSTSSRVSPVGNVVYIGQLYRSGFTNEMPLDGEIDQVRIYNGAVSDIGVAALYAETASDNDDTLLGGPPETIISANANAGFSIVKYEGNGSAGATIGHGLSAAPEMVIIKNLDSAVDWRVGHTSAGWTKFGKLNTTDAFSTSSVAWNDTAPSSTVVTLGTSSGLNSSGVNYIAYCFHSVSGFSKISSYTGNGSTTGPTVTTGFQPDFVMIKRIDNTADWVIVDSVRGGSKYLKPNSSDAETSSDRLTFTSTGFQLITTGANVNYNGDDYIYAAFKIN